MAPARQDFTLLILTNAVVGVAPMISCYHGEQNHEKLKKLVGFSVRFNIGASVLCTVVSILAAALLLRYRKRYGY